MTDTPVALVTGGGTGIGAACCRALAAEGFRVAVHYRSSEEKARKLADAFTVQADLDAAEQIEALIGELKEKTGRVDLLVNSVAPGFIDTDMTAELPDEVRSAILARIPQQRMGTPGEVADVVAFLATRGSYVNGTVIHVNGGMLGG